MLVLVCGDREWTCREKIYDRLSKLARDTVVMQGACRGADVMAANIALELGLVVRSFPADWKKHGRSAGPIRNREMLNEKPDLVIAFHPDLAKSRGTRDTVNEATRRGIPVEVIS